MLQSLINAVEESLTTILFKKSLFITISIIFIYLFWKRRKEFIKDPILLLKYLICPIFWCLYIAASLDLVGFPPLSELKRYQKIGIGLFHPDISLIHGIIKDDILNIIFFIPLGFMLPLFWKGYRDIKKISFLSFCFSLFLEISQLFNLYRWSEVNDLIMNTLGGLFGWYCFSWLHKKVKKIDSLLVVENEKLSEPIIFTLICIVLEFLLAAPLF
ncbi:MAG: VanZ family protein [Streptococcaceae bacterium]|jgi:glycopeptide antibiotics resistance protein|nr:VanZ family protein [Streptococcaceae bacterium]